MAYYRDGLKHPTHIWEAAAMHRLIRVDCRAHRCANSATFDPHALWGLFHKRHWDDRYSVAQHRFWCRVCTRLAGFKVKAARMSDTGSSRGDVTHPLPMPSERDWKAFLNRHKG